METFEIALDEKANKVVILPEIVFTNKQNIKIGRASCRERV